MEGKNPHVFIPRSHHLMHLPKAITKGWGVLFCKTKLSGYFFKPTLSHELIELEGTWISSGVERVTVPKFCFGPSFASGHEEPKPNVTKKFATIKLSATIFNYCLRGGIHATIKQPHSREEI